MRLSELKTGEKAVIVKVLGHGGFRKRIIEMGFVRGRVVESLLDAPLLDPVKYRVMGYEVSLRRSEAANIEIVSHREVMPSTSADDYNGVLSEDELRRVALLRRKHLNVALVGNPNCGKTTLFNRVSGAHEHVGNYSGVTVDAKSSRFRFRGYEFTLVDLPGTYSLTTYTPEELYVRRHLAETAPDVVINVVDGSNLERNLFLTTQLIDMNVRMVVALNMYDELIETGAQMDHLQLSRLLGAPVVPTNARKGWGLDTLFHIAIKAYEGTDFYTKEGEIDLERLNEMHEYHHRLHLDHDPLEELHEDETHARENIRFDPVRHHHHHHRRWGKKPESSAHALRDHHHEHRYTMDVMTRHIHVNHGPEIERAIAAIRSLLVSNESLRAQYSTRYLAIKLLEGDALLTQTVREQPGGERVLEVRHQQAELLTRVLHEDPESAITNAKYGFIAGALKETLIPGRKPKADTTKTIDKWVLNRYLGYPIFLLFLFVMFEGTFVLGNYPKMWMESGIQWLSGALEAALNPGPLRDLLVDGIVGGVGGVVVFLPNILILYLFISFMEDSGYMARAAFIMDKIMHRMGLHGKSFIPMIMGFGCSVPAILSARTIENRNSRMITILITPLMSCSARLPVYLLLAGAFFPAHAGLVLFGLYLLGILLAALMARLFKRFLFRGKDMPFVMELPPYRMPTALSIFRHMWDKGAQYLKKMGSVILLASILIWFLGYYPRASAGATTSAPTTTQQQENSYIGQLGRWVEPALRPLGFDWKISVAVVTGITAKEVVVSTLGVLYGDGGEGAVLSERMKADVRPDGSPVFNGAVALSLMVFVLLYMPCIATVTAIKNETGRWLWGLFAMAYTLALAWGTSFIVYRLALWALAV
jgi:ferrous iron transport protein B